VQKPRTDWQVPVIAAVCGGAVLIAVIVLLTGNSSVSLAPEMPVDTAWRQAVLQPGWVLKLTNNSGRILGLMVTCKDLSSKEKFTRSIDIRPNQTRELGWAQGWNFVSGDEVVISHHDYKSIHSTAP